MKVRLAHSIALVAALLATTIARDAASAASQTEPEPGPSGFVVFARGRQIGREEARLLRTADGWTITATGRLDPPVDIETRHFEIRYSSDWQPLALRLEMSSAGRPLSLSTSFGLTTATSEIARGDERGQKTDVVPARAIVLPNHVFAAYEALAARLAVASAGETLPIYVAPDGEITASIDDIAGDRLTAGGERLETRRARLTFRQPGGALTALVWIDARGRLARLEIPSAGLQVVRDDVARAAAPSIAHPGDERVTIPASGF
ncbi:MAG TPA: hypothetical protein VNI83_07470, partial [Vicinamibacterales bacterium]|nr:hypothetical protein [Vicinamibacterales bacterium]